MSKRTVLLIFCLILMLSIRVSAQRQTAVKVFSGVLWMKDTALGVGVSADIPIVSGLFFNADAGTWFKGTSFFFNGGFLYMFQIKKSPVNPFIVIGASYWDHKYEKTEGMSYTYEKWWAFKLSGGAGLKAKIRKKMNLCTEFRVYFLDDVFMRLIGGVEFLF